MGIRRGILAASLIFYVVSAGFGQKADETFGKNRLQYRQFNWQYLAGKNFDIYFYDNRAEVARDALEYLEGEFDRITDLIGYPPYFKTKVFLYNSLADLRQSNVGLNRTVFTVGGETEFVKPYVEVAHLGNVQEFKEELLYQIANLMVDEMMFGGNLKDIFQSALLLNLPEWFVNGASLYISKGWTVEMDDFIRQFIQKKRSRKLAKLNGREAALAGQSVWNFIAEKYGKSSIANILNYTRLTRNEEKSILITLGVSYKQLMVEWEQFYAGMEADVSKSYVSPADSTLFTLFHNKTTQYTTVKISSDGRYIAYAENDRGRYMVKVKELATDREKIIISGGSKVINQRVDYNVPLISWADEHTLGVIGLKKGQYVFWLYDLSTNSKLPRILDKFSNVRSFDFSSNGRLVILSADFEGQNDLFLASSRRDRVRRLTNDIYDDLDPSFLPQSNGIVFSSNRTSDSLKVEKNMPLESLTDNYNLFVFDLDSTKNLLTRVTNTLSKDYAPRALDQHTFIYLSDQRGITNLFKYDLSTGIYSQLTNFSSSVEEYDLSFSSKKFAIVATKNMEENIFISTGFDANRQVFTPATRRKDLQQARVIRARKKQEADNEAKTMSVKDLLNERMKDAKEETPASDSTTVQHPERLDSVRTDSTVVHVNEADSLNQTDSVKIQNVQPEKTQPDKDVVNTDDYDFEDEQVKETQPGETFLTRYMKARETSRITGPFPYESKFSADNLITSLVIDPLRGLGMRIETQMNDMLENYRFFGGIMTTIDLHNSDVYAELQYLPAYIDFSARFDRKAIRWEPPSNINDTAIYNYNYTLHKLEVGGSMPLNDRARFTLKPFFELTRSVNLGVSDRLVDVPKPAPVSNFYAGLRSEIVYDNSVSTGMNIIEGTRGKVAFIHHQGVNNEDNSFSQVYVDLRHYQKIYKEIVFAVRGFAGTFFGRSPKQYLLGGMDNWFFNKSQEEGTTGTGEPNPIGVYNRDNQDLLFVEYVTSLRGFDYATLFGNKVLLFNAELRIPLARTLAGGPISSNFFRNMQLTGFYDIGTSWSGDPPFDSQTSVSYKLIHGGPFEAQLKNFLNPWLYSYGVGLRSVMLGYYLKFDLAWPVQNFEVGEPRLYVTLGFDF